MLVIPSSQLQLGPYSCDYRASLRPTGFSTDDLFAGSSPNISDAMTNEQSSIVYLLKKLRDDTTTLVRDEIWLAKAEISEKIASASRNVGYLAAGALAAYAALMLILQGISFLLRKLLILGGMNQASASLLSFLIVGAVVGAIGAILIVKAVNTLKKEPLTPTKTAETLKEDKEWVQSKVS